MSERLTKKFCGGYGLVKVRDDEQEVDSPYKNTLQSILECFERLGKIEDVLYDASGNEVIALARLRELASAEREGRVVVLNEIFKTPTGQYGFIYYDKQGLMTGDFRDTKAESEAARALAATEPKGDAT